MSEREREREEGNLTRTKKLRKKMKLACYSYLKIIKRRKTKDKSCNRVEGY